MRMGRVGVKNRYLQITKRLFKRDITRSSYFIFLKEYTFEHDGIQHENLRIYVYNEEKFYEILGV